MFLNVLKVYILADFITKGLMDMDNSVVDCWGEESIRGLNGNGEKNTIKINFFKLLYYNN